MSSKTSHAARWSAAVWSTTCGSTGSGARPGARTRSPRTGANNCAPSASPSEHTAEFAGWPTSPALAVRLPAMAPTFAVVGRSQVDGRRLQRAATVLGSPRRKAFARGDGLAGGRRLLGVLGLVVNRDGRLRGVAAGVGAGDVDGVTRDRSHRAVHRRSFGRLGLRAFAIDGGVDAHGCRGDRLAARGFLVAGPHADAAARGDVGQRGRG